MPTTIQQRRPALPKISEFAKDGRAQLLKHVQMDIAALKAEIKTLEETERALKGNGPSVASTRARAGNGAKTTSRKPKTTTSKTLTEPMVIRAIKAGNYQTSQLTKLLRVSPNTIARWLSKLEAANFVYREGAGSQTRWTLTEKGMAAAS